VGVVAEQLPVLASSVGVNEESSKGSVISIAVGLWCRRRWRSPDDDWSTEVTAPAHSPELAARSVPRPATAAATRSTTAGNT
jgi:hypothetical protein